MSAGSSPCSCSDCCWCADASVPLCPAWRSAGEQRRRLAALASGCQQRARLELALGSDLHRVPAAGDQQLALCLAQPAGTGHRQSVAGSAAGWPAAVAGWKFLSNPHRPGWQLADPALRARLFAGRLAGRQPIHQPPPADPGRDRSALLDWPVRAGAVEPVQRTCPDGEWPVVVDCTAAEPGSGAAVLVGMAQILLALACAGRALAQQLPPASPQPPHLSLPATQRPAPRWLLSQPSAVSPAAPPAGPSAQRRSPPPPAPKTEQQP
jgi:hypothetical protein